MIQLEFKFIGFDEAADRFDQLAMMLENLTEAWYRVRFQVWEEIRLLFDVEGRGRAHPWMSWSGWTMAARRDRSGYYSRSGPVQDSIGIWASEIRNALTSDTEPGYSDIQPDRLTMGIARNDSDPKYHVFIQGRPERSGFRLWYIDRFGGEDSFQPNVLAWRGQNQVYAQPPRHVYENLYLEVDDERNPIVRGFDQWFRERFTLDIGGVG